MSFTLLSTDDDDVIRELALTLSCHTPANIVLRNVNLAICARTMSLVAIMLAYNAQMLPFLLQVFPFYA